MNFRLTIYGQCSKQLLIDIQAMEIYRLDGLSLTLRELDRLASKTTDLLIDLEPQSWALVKKSRDTVVNIMKESTIVYGINTGFGNFANVVISKQECKHLQLNLIRSHSCGVGKPIPLQDVRKMLLLRINTLAKGRSGISVNILKKLVAAFNANYLPMIPEQGTVGASGDLAPLSHLALGLLGEGLAWNEQQRKYTPAAPILKNKNLFPLELEEKEGLALINGTQFMSAIISGVIVKAERLLQSAKVVFAFAVELFGMDYALFTKKNIQVYKNDQSQLAKVLTEIGNILNEDSPSQLHSQKMKKKNNGVADSMMKCIQSLSATQEALNFCSKMITEEINGATDNPLVYFKEDGLPNDRLVSAGNFHGEYVAKASDFVAMSLFHLGRFSQARIERYMNGRISQLPSFLVKEGGLNSGFMIAQYTSASLLSETKVLLKPSSADSISTSASQEDHVSMGGYAARKCQTVLDNVAYIIGIELMMCLTAVDLEGKKTCQKLLRIKDRVRKEIPFMARDRHYAPEIELARHLVLQGL